MTPVSRDAVAERVALPPLRYRVAATRVAGVPR
jgi:hypothetical protein